MQNGATDSLTGKCGCNNARLLNHGLLIFLNQVSCLIREHQYVIYDASTVSGNPGHSRFALETSMCHLLETMPSTKSRLAATAYRSAPLAEERLSFLKVLWSDATWLFIT